MGASLAGTTAKDAGDMSRVSQQNPFIDYFGKQQDRWRAVYIERCPYGSGGSRLSRACLPHDSAIFLGGKEETTLKSWSALLGKELMSVDELAVMDGGKCLLQLRGARPFYSDKYDITRHPNYKYLSDYNDKNKFDIEKYLSTRMRPRPDEVY